MAGILSVSNREQVNIFVDGGVLDGTQRRVNTYWI